MAIMYLIIIIVLIVCGIYFFLQTAQFGAKPTGERLSRIQLSPNYRNGMFQNISVTPQLTGGKSFLGVMFKILFNQTKHKIPPAILPSVKTNLLTLEREENMIVWFGHSSYFLQLDQKTFLVDPVFSGNASPLSFTTKSFPGSDVYAAADFPDIDYLIITHDHWDHLDYETVLSLKSKVKRIITGLGVGAHLQAWGFENKIIIEKDWNEEIITDKDITFRTTTARHFSGRSLSRNNTIWSSFILKTKSKNIFIGGDSGYDIHFGLIGQEYGPFDLAILENGQYNESWAFIHMTPEETVQAALDLRAHKLLPVHWSKFKLSIHAWDEPIKRIQKEALIKNMPLLHPMIGEKINLEMEQVFTFWWENVK